MQNNTKWIAVGCGVGTAIGLCISRVCGLSPDVFPAPQTQEPATKSLVQVVSASSTSVASITCPQATCPDRPGWGGTVIVVVSGDVEHCPVLCCEAGSPSRCIEHMVPLVNKKTGKTDRYYDTEARKFVEVGGP